MTEQECRALFFQEAYVLASSEPEMYRGFKLGLKIGAAAEREACANVCEELGKEYNNEINKKFCIGDELQSVANDCAEAIRARGQE